jgi:hypothetical protein
VGFGSFLKSKDGFAAIFAMRVAAGQRSGFCNPHAVFVLPHLYP